MTDDKRLEGDGEGRWQVTIVQRSRQDTRLGNSKSQQAEKEMTEDARRGGPLFHFRGQQKCSMSRQGGHRRSC